MIRGELIIACVVIIIVELFEWLTGLKGKIYNYTAGLVIGMAVLCIAIVVTATR
jgi:hypothetical protein